MNQQQRLVGEIERATSRGQLMRLSIVSDLLLQTGLTRKQREDLLAAQARVAQDQRDRRWLRRISQDALEFGLSSREWIDNHIMALPQQKKRVSDLHQEPCRDIRLKDNPRIQLIVSDAATESATSSLPVTMDPSTSPDKKEDELLAGFDAAVLECSVNTIDIDHLLDMSTDSPVPAPTVRASTPDPAKKSSPQHQTEKIQDDRTSRATRSSRRRRSPIARYSQPDRRHGHRRASPPRRDRSARNPQPKSSSQRDPAPRSRRDRDQELSRGKQSRGDQETFRSRSRREERVARRSPVRQRVRPAVLDGLDACRPRAPERTVTVQSGVSGQQQQLQDLNVHRRMTPVRQGEASHEVVPAVGRLSTVPVSVSSTGPSKKAQRRKLLRNRHQACIIPDCSRPHKFPKLHILLEHLPVIFDEFQPTSDFTTRQRLAALKLISGWILGGEHLLFQLAAYIEGTDLLKEQHNEEVTPQTITAVTELCREGSMHIPETFTLRPLSTPMMLFHWRPMSILVARLEPCYRKSLLEIFNTDYQPQGAEARCVTVPPPPPTELSEEDLDEEDEEGLLAFDSHFHFDRLRKEVNPTATFQELCDSQSVDPEYAVSVVGGTANFCDPPTFPTDDLVQQLFDAGVCVTIGLHPKKVHLFNATVERRMDVLLESPNVVGLGEIGLDRTAPSATYAMQKDLFKHLLHKVKPHHVLVLHCRGRRGEDDYQFFEMLDTVKEVIPRDQPIHLHCFSGSDSVVKKWLELYPRTYFGFTNLVRSFNKDQLQGLRAVPDERMLLETDAPYFPTSGGDVSCPGILGQIADLVSNRRQEDWKELLAYATVNAIDLYIPS